MDDQVIRIQVTGMTCGHCEASVTAALSALPSASNVAVDRVGGIATFVAPPDFDVTIAVRAVQAIGFDAAAIG